MLTLLILFLILALIFGVLGFGAIIQGLVSIAIILFWIFVALFIISLVVRLVRGR